MKLQINMELKTSAKNTINIEDLFISTAKQLLSKQTNNPVGVKEVKVEKLELIL